MTNDNILIKQIIETDNIIGTKYYQFLKIAIKTGDNSRFGLIDFPASLLQVNWGDKKISKNNLYNLLNPTLFRINQLAIDNNDFEIFKHEINQFSTFQVLTSPIKIIEDIENDFYELSNSLYFNNLKFKPDEEIESQNEHFRFLVKHNLLKNFEFWDDITTKLDVYQNKLLNNIDEYQEKEKLNEGKIEDDADFIEIKSNINELKKKIVQIIQGNKEIVNMGIKHKLYEFWINSLIYKTFFMIGAYSIFCNRNKDINGANFIRELWFHTKPTNKNETFIIANTPVIFNSTWLIFLYLYGGKGNTRWLNWPNYVFDDYHEAKPYVTQYFLLCLSKTNDFNIFPSEDSLMSIKSKDNSKELEELYDLVYGFYSDRSNLISNIDLLIDESEEWDDLLSYSEIENGEKIAISANEVFNNTKRSINEIIPNLKELEDKIIELLPLDDEKTNAAFKRVYQSYEENSKLSKFESKEYIGENGLEKEFIPIEGLEQLIDRRCLVKTGTILYFDCSVVWSRSGRNIANNEFKELNDVIIAKKDIYNSVLKNKTPENIYKKIIAITKDLDDQYNPDTIILPKQTLYEFRKFSVNPESVLHNKVKNNKFIKINDDTELEIIISPFHNIVVLDRKAISFFYRTDSKTKKRILIDITEPKESPSNLKINIKSLINVDISDPEKIKIIQI